MNPNKEVGKEELEGVLVREMDGGVPSEFPKLSTKSFPSTSRWTKVISIVINLHFLHPWPFPCSRPSFIIPTYFAPINAVSCKHLSSPIF